MKYETIVCPFCGNGHAHITYEENRVYQMNCPDCHNAIFHRDTSWDNAVNFFKRMVVTDEAAIRRRERNDPLTMDELRKMDGEPVWVCFIDGVVMRDDGWFILALLNESQAILEGKHPVYKNLEVYGKSWIAYRQKPEEDHHDSN